MNLNLLNLKQIHHDVRIRYIYRSQALTKNRFVLTFFPLSPHSNLPLFHHSDTHKMTICFPLVSFVYQSPILVPCSDSKTYANCIKTAGLPNHVIPIDYDYYYHRHCYCCEFKYLKVL